MEYGLLIVFIIVVLLILYILYEFYNNWSSADNVYGLIDLNSPPIEIITASSLTNPASNRYAFAGWLYINSWNMNDYKYLITKTPFTTTAGNKFSDITNTADFCLLLDKSQPNLIFEVTSLQASIPIAPISIISGVSLQTWTHIVISVDSQIVDAYVNGKLVLSHKLEAMPQTTNSGIIFGNGLPMDIKLSGFERWGTSIGPETAWKAFLNTKPT
jgi:hypothetical protein